MNLYDVRTHSGAFHSDEISALACAIEFWGLDPDDISRVREASTDDLSNPNITFIDIGGSYSIEYGNFDHHHDDTLEASNLLLFDWLLIEWLYTENHPQEEVDALIAVRNRVLLPLSECDKHGTTQLMEAAKDFPIPQRMLGLVEIIRALNWEDDKETAFWKAIDLVRITVRAVYNQALSQAKGEKQWAELVEKKGSYAIQRFGGPIAGWQQLAKRDGVHYLVSTSKRNPGRWVLISRDSGAYPITPTGQETFLHNAKFYAEYPTQELAEQAAVMSILTV